MSKYKRCPICNFQLILVSQPEYYDKKFKWECPNCDKREIFDDLDEYWSQNDVNS